LFISGDGGWNLGVVDMARTLASLDALVVGVDIVHYVRELGKSNEKCSYPAADFELLSKFVQKKFNYKDYITPILVGYSSGATLAYATIVQAPPTTFKGAISLGFCPDLPLTKPLCKGSGLLWKTGPKGKGYSFLPAAHLEVPWVALQGTIDQVCNPDETKSYVSQVKGCQIIILPKVGHGFAVPKNWLPQFKQAFLHIAKLPSAQPAAPKASAIYDLPVIEVPSATSAREFMAVHITGDGGWGVTDRGLSQALAAQGIPVVGLNSLKYFWQTKSPEKAAHDLERILRYYLAAWKKERAIIIGYSFGADVLPFMVSRLSEEYRSKIKLIVLLGPGLFAEFEFHITDWLQRSLSSTRFPVASEIEKLRGKDILCFYGEDDQESLCAESRHDSFKTVMLKGGHRIGGNFDPVVQRILEELK
jgi:type IV secretory pathway VirJ component